jgi:23S rRNA (guanosine2251-2'-O)-methyltransferase
MKTEVIYGIHPVLEGLKADRRDFHQIYVLDQKISKRIRQIVSLADSRKIEIKPIQRPKMKEITGTDQHQGIGASVDAYPLVELSDLLGRLHRRQDDPFLLLLDNVMDPSNLGALIRTALCVGTDGIILPKDRSASPTPAVSKASAGALEHAVMVRVNNLVNVVKLLKKEGVWIIGLDQIADKSAFKSNLKGPVAIVIGGEGKGIRPLVKKNCDFLISIPQQGPVESLNASAAGAVAMYEVFRQRQ